MKNWASIKLAEATTKVGSGATPKGGQDSYQMSGVPLIRSMNVRFEGFDREGLVFLSEEQARALDGVVVARDDVLLNITGASIGRVTLAPADMEGARVNQHVCIIRPRAGLEPKFVGYLLQAPAMQQMIMSEQYGATRQALTKAMILDFDIPLPPLNEQRRIIARLETLLARSRRAKSALRAIPALLERFRQSVLAAAFRGDLTRDWRAANPDVEPASRLLDRIRSERRRRWEAVELEQMRLKGKAPKDERWKEKYVEPVTPSRTVLPPIPDSWSWVTLPELGELARGKSKHRPRNDPRLFGGPYPFIQTGEVARARGKITNAEQTLSEFGLAQSRLFPAGTVCITIAANIADSAVLAIPACFPDSVVGLIPDHQFTSAEYVEFFIRTAKADLTSFAPATAQKNINLEVLSEVAIPVPPPAERLVIEAKVANALAAAQSVEKQVLALDMRCDAFDDSVLAFAFRGDLVPQDPTDEPASDLRDRIRVQRESDVTEAAKPSMRGRRIA